MNLESLQEGQALTSVYEMDSMNLIWEEQGKSGKGNNLWLGGLTAAEKIDELQKNNIKAVITIAEGTKLKYIDNIISEHLVIPALDIEHYDIQQHFSECQDFINVNLAHGSVLVHCMAGVSRSASIVIAYLMRRNKWTLEKALKYAHGKRKQVSPNYGFLKQLRDYEFDLFIGHNGEEENKA